jgi:hypothetical protein
MAAAIDKTARCVLRANGSANRMGPLCWNRRFSLRFATGAESDAVTDAPTLALFWTISTETGW